MTRHASVATYIRITLIRWVELGCKVRVELGLQDEVELGLRLQLQGGLNGGG